MVLRIGIIFSVALVLATFSGGMSLAKAIERVRPETALLLPGHTGFTEANAARQIISAGRTVEGQRALKLDPEMMQAATALSQNAYNSEPLSSQALANLAFLAEARGDQAAATRLMFGAATLTNREIDINNWMLEFYAKRQDAAQALQTYDLILRSSETARSASIPIVVQFLANSQLVKPMTDLLAARPPWEDDFWNEAFKVEAALGNVAQVRINLAIMGAEIGNFRNARSDQLLIDALVQAKQFAQADALYRSIANAPANPAQLVPNGDFGRANNMAPFDWELSFGNSYAAAIEPTTGRLRVETFANADGRVARNLVRLDGDKFTLKVSAEEWDTLDADALYFQVTCAENAATPSETMRINLVSAELNLDFRKPNPSCVYHWLEIIARAHPQQRDNTTLLNSVSIRASR